VLFALHYVLQTAFMFAAETHIVNGLKYQLEATIIQYRYGPK